MGFKDSETLRAFPSFSLLIAIMHICHSRKSVSPQTGGNALILFLFCSNYQVLPSELSRTSHPSQ